VGVSWYAAWDLAFHTLPLAIVDPDFAKQQMELMLQGYTCIPVASSCLRVNFSDVNPPVHAWATLFLHRTEQALRGEGDVDFLKSAFNKLLLNFTWWANRKDRFGKNLFEVAFSASITSAYSTAARRCHRGRLEQADGTAWMALFSQNMLELAVEIAAHDHNYEDMVFKFVEHFYYIAAAMNQPGANGMWDERTDSTTTCWCSPTAAPPGSRCVRSWGCYLCAPHRDRVMAAGARPAGDDSNVGTPAPHARTPECHPSTGPDTWAWPSAESWPWSTRSGSAGFLRRCSTRTSSWVPWHPLDLEVPRAASLHLPRERRGVSGGLPAGRVEHRMFGGNSNWRGPVWMPVNAMIIRALLQFYLYYGDNFKVECPTDQAGR